MKKVAHVVLQGKILQKPTLLMEEDCLVLHLPDVEERICQVKEEPRRMRIEAKRFKEGWKRMPLVSVRGRKRWAKGASAHQLR